MNEIVKEFENLLNSSVDEEELHQFLYKNSYLLAEFGYGVKRIFSKPSFGSDFKADFALLGWGNYHCWTFVEIKKSSDPLFTKEGLLSNQLNRAITQINSWWVWLYDYGDYAVDCYEDLSGDTNALIIIGRRSTLSKTDIKRLKQLNSTQLNGKLRIVTYDAILDYAKSLGDQDVDWLKIKCKKLNEFATVKDFNNYQQTNVFDSNAPKESNPTNASPSKFKKFIKGIFHSSS